ncbi:MAG TPA: hypothetical protein VK886_09190 [Vicinamibacterales bacterium]|nr:hypothetical protein [Vicinamibacterales bacterium]
MRPLRRRERTALVIVVVLAAVAHPFAFGGRVARIRAVSATVRAAIELRDAFPESLRQVLERGGTLHVRVEGALWEDRALWDRPLEPPRVSVFRIVREPNGAAIAVVDSGGGTTVYKPYPDPLTIDVDLGAADKLVDAAKYYFDGVVSIGTITDEDVEEANEAVFGRDDGPAGLKRVGRFLLNTVLQVSDYVKSVTTDVRSGRMTGAQIKA